MAATIAILIYLAGMAVAVATARSARSHAGVPKRVDQALHLAAKRYGVSYWEMRSVSYCESQWNPNAVNGSGSGSSGLFQFLPSTFRHTPYGRRSIFDPFANALAAAWLVRQDGGWGEWVCKP